MQTRAHMSQEIALANERMVFLLAQEAVPHQVVQARKYRIAAA